MKSLKRLVEHTLDRAGAVFQAAAIRMEVGTDRRTSTILAALGGIALLTYMLFISAPSAFPRGELIEIPEGMPLSEIAELLERQHVVRSALALQASVYLLGHEREVQFGDYLFKGPRNVFSVARAIGIGA